MKTVPTYPEIVWSRPDKPRIAVAEDGEAGIAEVAAYFDIDVKRLRGWIFQKINDGPIGDIATGRCYFWSVQPFVDRMRAACLSEETNSNVLT
jgi:hypothetical protein